MASDQYCNRCAMEVQIEQQKQTWRDEQLDVASKVKILPPIPSSVVIDSRRFKFLSLIQVGDFRGKNNTVIYFGGVDVSFPNVESNADGSAMDTSQDEEVKKPPSVAVYVILEYPSGRIVYQDHEYFTLDVPYIPSYLAFREIEPLVRLILKQISQQPELTPRAVLVDGNGRLHPRRAGLACFVGVRTGLPTIGVGKTIFCEGGLTKEGVLQDVDDALDRVRIALSLDGANPDAPVSNANVKRLLEHHQPNLIILGKCGRSEDAPDMMCTGTSKLSRGDLVKAMGSHCRGLAVPLKVDTGSEKDEVIAYALVGHGGHIKSKASASTSPGGTKNPIYISVGHKISLEECVRICASFAFAKIPEPVRQADLIGRDLLREKHKKR